MHLIHRGKKWAILIFHMLYSLNTHWPSFPSWKHSVRPLSLSGSPLVSIKFNSQQLFCNSVSTHWSVSLLSSMWVYFGLTSCVWGIPSFPFFPPPFLQWACGFLGPLPRQGAGERRLNWCSTTSSPRNKDPESLCLLIPEVERLLWWQTRHRTQREVTHAAALLRIHALAWRKGACPLTSADSICCWRTGYLSNLIVNLVWFTCGIFSNASFQLKTLLSPSSIFASPCPSRGINKQDLSTGPIYKPSRTCIFGAAQLSRSASLLGPAHHSGPAMASQAVFSAGIRYQFLNKNETASSTLMTRSRKCWPPAHQQNRVCVLRVNNGPILGKLVSVSQRVLNRERVCHRTKT